MLQVGVIANARVYSTGVGRGMTGGPLEVKVEETEPDDNAEGEQENTHACMLKKWRGAERCFNSQYVETLRWGSGQHSKMHLTMVNGRALEHVAFDRCPKTCGRTPRSAIPWSM